MSESGEGANATIVAAQDVATIPPVVNAVAAESFYDPFS